MKVTLLLKKFYDSKLLTSLLLTGMLIVTSRTALADYQPPPKEETNNNSSGLIARGGCQGNAKTYLTALAPQKHHVGTTVSTHPTFAWFVPDSQPYQLKFQLYQYDASGKLDSVWQQDLQSQPGIMTLSLPAEKPGLSVGQRYLWKVIVLCNPNRPSNSLVVEADLDVIATPKNLETQLNSTNEPMAIADLYAEAGIWYDALAKAIALQESETGERFELKLLETLAKIEEDDYLLNNQTPEDESIKQDQKLRQVIEAEQQKSVSYQN